MLEGNTTQLQGKLSFSLSSVGTINNVLTGHRFKGIKFVFVLRSYVVNNSCSGEVIVVVNSRFQLLSCWERSIG